MRKSHNKLFEQGAFVMDEVGCDFLMLLTPCYGDTHAVNLQLIEIEKLPSNWHLNREFHFPQLVPKTHCWRTIGRISRVNVEDEAGRLQPNLKQAQSLAVARKYLGSCCPSEALLKNDSCGGFRALAVTMSCHLGVVITPLRAFKCFTRSSNQLWGLTDYGRSLLAKFGKSWPPIIIPTVNSPPDTATHMDDSSEMVDARFNLQVPTNELMHHVTAATYHSPDLNPAPRNKSPEIVDVFSNLHTLSGKAPLTTTTFGLYQTQIGASDDVVLKLGLQELEEYFGELPDDTSGKHRWITTNCPHALRVEE